MAKITYVNKVENEGLTGEGRVFAVDLNEIKTVINTNEDLRVGQTPVSGAYSSLAQSILFRNSVNSIVFSVSLADLVTGGGGIADAPTDNSYYARRNGVWVSFSSGITDAPSNQNTYGRSGGQWVVIPGSIGEAPIDNNYYARRNGVWSQISSGGSVSSHNDLTGRSDTDCHPISSITDLQTTLTGKAALAGNINQDFSTKILTVGNSIVLNGRSLTIRTL